MSRSAQITVTPEEIDDLLAQVSASDYASTAVARVEAWFEERCGFPGDYTLKERGQSDVGAAPTVAPGQMTLGE